MAEHAAGSSIWAFQTSNVVFFLAVRPEHVSKFENIVGSIPNHISSLINTKEVLRPVATVATTKQGESDTAKPHRRKRRKRKKPEESVHYEIRVSGWDYYYHLRLSDPKDPYDRGAYNELATLSFKGELISPEDLPYVGVLTLSARAGMMDEEYDELPKSIGSLSVSGDTLTADVFVPAERLSELATVAASGWVHAASLVASKLRHHSGKVHSVSITTELEEDDE